MNEVLIWIKDILGQYATPIITIGTFIAGLVVTIKTFGLGKLFSGLKTLISGIFGKEETSPLNVFKTELKAMRDELEYLKRHGIGGSTEDGISKFALLLETGDTLDLLNGDSLDTYDTE